MQKLNRIKDNLAWHKILRIRKRYVVSRSNIPRLRYIFPMAAVFFLSAISTSTLLDRTSAGSKADQGLSNVGFVQQTNQYGTNQTASNASQRALPDNFLDLVRLNPRAEEAADNRLKTLEIKSGQTLAGILQDNGISGNDAYLTVKALSEYIDPRKIKPGQTFTIRVENDQGSEESVILSEFVMDVDSIRSVHITKQNDEFLAELNEKEISKRTYAGATQIQTSLYGSAARSGIPAPVIAKMIRMYSWSVDFQRDIRRNDQIELLYEVYETEDGETVKYGDILYANLNVLDTDLPLYRFEKGDGQVDYYDSRGQSIKKTLMKTPVDGARMSSKFGMRRHPILGYNKMHKGVDFAAPLGTPIYAAGDGVLEKVGRNGGYGNYMRIRHTNGLKTAYAHLHKFAKGMSVGKRVKQGQVIGYIGSTGRSTGPHLHYEVILNGKQVNPNRVDLPIGDSLKGKDLDNFKRYISKYDQMYAELSRGQKFASLDSDNKEDEDKKKKAG